MALILYIEASPMGDLSFSTRVARAFLDAYQQANPKDVVRRLNLWEEDVPAFDFTAASGKYKTMRGLDHSAEEADAWARVVRQVEQFKSADKVVLSSGMWNFSIPYRLKQYIDNIVQPGLTFSFDPQKGYSGLVTGRPVQLILARGGQYPEDSPMDFQAPYLERIFGFMGFTDIRTLKVEGTLFPNAEEAIEGHMEQAREAAGKF